MNSVVVSVQSAFADELVVVVPQGTNTGKIRVSVQGKTTVSTQDYVVVFPPVITDFTPKTGNAGDIVNIMGTHFDITIVGNTIKFNGITAVVTSVSATALNMIVPAGSATGKITLEINGQVATSVVDFIVTSTSVPAPMITSFAPKTGVAGDIVTITGNNFDVIPANNVIKFQGVVATVQAATMTGLKVVVPAQATTGKITVKVDNQTATSANDFVVMINPTGLPEKLNQGKLIIFPNPVLDVLRLHIESIKPIQEALITIYNV